MATTSGLNECCLGVPTKGRSQMSAKNAAAETVFDKKKRREAEINGALEQERTRHEAAVKNMNRLRSLRLERDAAKPQPEAKPSKRRRTTTSA
jgi:hypothetical protein